MSAEEKQRLDKWLWHARFFKTRTVAAKMISGGHCRVNSNKVAKPAFQVTAGDVLTFPQGDWVRIIEVVALGDRRGPSPEAQTLYSDKTPPREKDLGKPEREGNKRPTKKDRRTLDLLRSRTLE